MSLRLGRPRRFWADFQGAEAHGEAGWPGSGRRQRDMGLTEQGSDCRRRVDAHQLIDAAKVEARVLQPTDSARQFLPFPLPPTPPCLRAFTKTEGETAVSPCHPDVPDRAPERRR